MSSPRGADVMTTRRRCRQLLSLSYPKPLLQKLKVQKSRQIPQEPNSSNIDNGAPRSEEGECFVCSSGPADDGFLAGLSIGQLQLLSNVFAPPTRDNGASAEVNWNWKFCSDCLSIIRRLLNLKEEMEDITLKIKAVLKLRYQCLDDSDIISDVHLNNSYHAEDITALSGPEERDDEDSNPMDAVEIPMSPAFSETSVNSELKPDAPSEPCAVDDPRGCDQDDVERVQEEDANQNHVVDTEIVQLEPVLSKRSRRLKLHCKICRKHFTDIWKFKRHSLTHAVRTKKPEERLTQVKAFSAPCVVDVQQIDVPQHNTEVSMAKGEDVNKDGEDKEADEDPTTIEPRPKRASRFRAEQMIKSLTSRNNCNREDYDSSSECLYSSSDDDDTSSYDNNDDDTIHHCIICGTNYSSKRDLIRHQKTQLHATNKMSKTKPAHTGCSDETPGDGEVESRNKSGNAKYYCIPCNKLFFRTDRFTSHMEKGMHRISDSLLKCGYCFRVFPTYGFFQDHRSICNQSPLETMSTIPNGNGEETNEVRRGKCICGICDGIFISKEHFESHLREGHNVHTKESHIEKLHEKQDPKVGNTVHHCKICGKDYSSKRDLKKHRGTQLHATNISKSKLEHIGCSDEDEIPSDGEGVSQNKSGNSKYYCKLCNKDFFRSDTFTRHMKKGLHRISDSFLKCGHCFRIFPSKACFRNHEQSNICNHLQLEFTSTTPNAEDTNEISYAKCVCGICDCVFISKEHFETHLRDGHNVHTKESHTEKLHEKQDPKSVGNCDRSCKLCGKICDNRRKLLDHQRSHKRFNVYGVPKKCSVCDEVFFLQLLFDAHTHLDDGSTGYVCSICNRTVSTRRNFRKHLATHRRTTSCQCETCGKVFVNPSTLKLHMMTVHVSHDEQVTCSICKKMFSSKIERVDHERVVHKGLPSLRCYFCSKYCQPATILPHILTHTKEKPYSCTVCRKKFSNPNTFKAHCDAVCGSNEAARDKVRKQRREMMRKYRAKLPYSCSFCSMKFAQKPQLETHVQRQHFEDNLLMKISV